MVSMNAMTPPTDTLMAHCTLCPRECGADRSITSGYCSGTDRVIVNTHQLHHWEEPVLSGSQGSGTIFFSNCTMRCVYCQNFEISWLGCGRPRTTEELCAMMIELQQRGAHNINLVTPSHYTPQIRDALRIALDRGLTVPVVWNSNAYEKPETLRLVEGLVDIYLPDFRYFNPATAVRYSGAPDYPEWAKKAIAEMHRQVGTLTLDGDIAKRGVLIRLLVLPGLTAEIKNMLEWIAAAIGPDTWISLMGQYYPTCRSHEFPEINRGITAEEYEECRDRMEELGFENGFVQGVGSSRDYTPDFRE